MSTLEIAGVVCSAQPKIASLVRLVQSCSKQCLGANPSSSSSYLALSCVSQDKLPIHQYLNTAAFQYRWPQAGQPSDAASRQESRKRDILNMQCTRYARLHHNAVVVVARRMVPVAIARAAHAAQRSWYSTTLETMPRLFWNMCSE